MVELSDVMLARDRLRPYLTPTRLEAAVGMNKVWLKLENTNITHSFKIRGALNAALALDESARARGLVAASSGNHAQGLAYAAQMIGVTAKILMPKHTPQRKVAGVQRAGAQAVLWGENYDEAEAEARRIEHDEKLTFISPYNDPFVVAGGGTIGLEILEQLPDVERILVCAGGGGLIGGIATAVKMQRPDIEIIGVCAEAAPAYYNALYGTMLPQVWDTAAEALSGDVEAGSITIPLGKQRVDRAVLVREAAIRAAMRWLIDVQGWLVEGGGAVGIAALQSGVIPLDDRPTVVVISGGNIDAEMIRAVLGC
jgi:threonine dehydratase